MKAITAITMMMSARIMKVEMAPWRPSSNVPAKADGKVIKFTPEDQPRVSGALRVAVPNYVDLSDSSDRNSPELLRLLLREFPNFEGHFLFQVSHFLFLFEDDVSVVLEFQFVFLAFLLLLGHALVDVFELAERLTVF